MYKQFLITVIIFISNFIFSQTGDKKFIMNLMEEEILTIQDKKDGKKYYDPEIINIKFDTLKTSSTYLDESFTIYKFNLDKNSVDYDRNKLVALFNSSSCRTYIVAVDQEGKTYKLSGFSKNDLLYFIDIVKKNLHDKSSKSTLNYLKENLPEIDIDCIYKSLKNENFTDKCIRPCSEGIRSH